MSTNVIKQTLVGEPGMQTIKQIVRSNERGPQGPKGDPGPQGPQGLPGERGADGVIQYRAGTGINISDENIITATGEATSVWGGIEGNIENQTDLTEYINEITPKKIWYGVSNTAGSQTIQVVTTTTGDFSFTPGDILVVYFKNAYTNTGTPRLTVDGSNSSQFIGPTVQWVASYAGLWEQNEIVTFVYNKDYNQYIPYFTPIGKTHASTTTTGIVQLYDGHDSTSTRMAATANSVKNVYDSIATQINTALAGTGYVGTTNIADGAVTTDKIANNTISEAKINGSTFDRITIRLEQAVTSAPAGIIALNKLGSSTGTRLSQSSDGGVLIGSGISKVRVSSSAFFNSSGKAYGWYELRKSGTTTGYQCIADTFDNTYGTATLSPIILDVQEGDILTLYNREAGVSIREDATYMTVEVVQ